MLNINVNPEAERLAKIHDGIPPLKQEQVGLPFKIFKLERPKIKPIFKIEKVLPKNEVKPIV